MKDDLVENGAHDIVTQQENLIGSVVDEDVIEVEIPIDAHDAGPHDLPDEALALRVRVLDVLENKPKEEMATLKSCDRSTLDPHIRLMNTVLKTISTRDTTEVNEYTRLRM